MNRPRVAALALVSAGLLGALPAATAGLALLWNLSVTPTTANAQGATTFTFTATNNLELLGIGCVEVDLPEGFELKSYGTPVASSGQPWEAYLWDDGDGHLTVVNHALSDFGVLAVTQSLTFTVRAKPGEAGTYEWTNHVHRSIGCDDFNDYGPPLEVTVEPASGPTPTPLPTPTPMPTPTPRPVLTPAPSARPTDQQTDSPSPAQPTATPTPRPRTDAATPTAIVSPSATPSATPSANPSSTPRAASPGNGGSANGRGGTDDPLRVPDLSVGWGGLGLGSLALLDAPVMWFVPAAVIGVPGLLVLLWVAAQTIGAAILVPAVRSWDEDGSAKRTKPRRSRPRRG